MSQGHRISFALGSATFCLVFPGIVALLFCIGKRFRTLRSCTQVILWTTVVMLLAALANYAQRAASSKLSRQNSLPSEPTEATKSSQGAVTSMTRNAAAATPDAATTKFVQAFPALYWYASDACLRETTRHRFGHPQKFDEFVKSYTADIEKFESLESRGGVRRYQLRLRLHEADSENSGEYWALEFAGSRNNWEPRSGYKYMNGKRVFDLFEDEYVVGVKAMGSMKPYFEKALAAYAAGKDLGTVFKKHDDRR